MLRLQYANKDRAGTQHMWSGKQEVLLQSRRVVTLVKVNSQQAHVNHTSCQNHLLCWWHLGQTHQWCLCLAMHAHSSRQPCGNTSLAAGPEFRDRHVEYSTAAAGLPSYTCLLSAAEASKRTSFGSGGPRTPHSFVHHSSAAWKQRLLGQ